MVGKALGPYKILEQLGAGGMGEVYLGEDTRLGRKVAIKVLPAEFASDSERLARFEQEARAAAALNHPHIAVVHDVGSEENEDGSTTHFMVQEYLEGRSLRQRLDRGALPLDRALSLAIEIDEAMVAAHRAGIIHRDLKPDNVFVTEEGHAKVLDFGLAKLTEMAAPTGSSASMSPTMLGTVAGQVMGTAGYMAPEQINGEEVDQRADLFAFGCVVYGMVTGRQPFDGKNVHETLGKILSDEPPSLADIDPSLPSELYRIIRKALAKNADNRYQTAGDLLVDLRSLGSDLEKGVTQPLSGAMPVHDGLAEHSDGMGWKLAAPLLVATAALTALLVWFGTRPATLDPPPLQHLGFDLPGEVRPRYTNRHWLTVSDDGRRLVFQADGALYLREMGRDGVEEIRGTDINAVGPFLSPGGDWVGFHSYDTRRLEKVPVLGGAPTPLCRDVEGENPLGASWAADGTILFGRGPGGIWRASADGGPCGQVIAVDDGQSAHSPHLLPDGVNVLFTLRSDGASFNDAEIVVHSLETDVRRPLGLQGADARYVPTGHIVFGRAGTLWAVAFDAERLEVTSGEQAVVEEVDSGAGFDDPTRDSTPGTMHYTFSQRGTLVYLRGVPNTDHERTLTWVGRDGTDEPIGSRQGIRNPILSPDGARVVMTADNGDENDVWIYDLATGSWTLLTSEGPGSEPIWSFDGEHIYFSADRGDGPALWRRRADKSSAAEQVWVPTDGRVPWPGSVSADGRSLFYTATELRTPNGRLRPGLWVVSLDDEEPQARPLLDHGLFDVGGPLIHPSGRWLAYISFETDTAQTHVAELVDGEVGSRYTVSAGFGAEPAWSRDGNELYYRDREQRMMVVSIETDPDFRPGEPQELMPFFPGLLPDRRNEYDVAQDGRFITTVGAGDGGRPRGEPTHIEVLVDWFEDLKARAPTGR